MTRGQDVNSPAVIVAAILFTVVGASAFLILPILIGAAAEDFQLNEGQLGFLSGASMAGSTISALMAVFWVRSVNWRLAMFVAMAVFGFGNLLAILVSDYTLLLMAIFIASIGGGTAYSLALTILSDNDNPDRVFGYSIAAQVSFQVIGLLAFPTVIGMGGLDALLAILCVLAIISLFAINFLPVSGKDVRLSNVFQIFTQTRVVFALLGCLFFFFNVGCFWTFIGRMGDTYGYSSQVIGNSLALGVSAGIVGSLCASWFGNKHGRLMPLCASAVGTVIAAILLNSSEALLIYVLAVALYNFVWNYSLAYQYAVVADVDESGRSVAIAPAFHAAGAAMGPAFAGMMVIEEGFIIINILVAVSVMISFALFIPACRMEQT